MSLPTDLDHLRRTSDALPQGSQKEFASLGADALAVVELLRRLVTTVRRNTVKGAVLLTDASQDLELAIDAAVLVGALTESLLWKFDRHRRAAKGAAAANQQRGADRAAADRLIAETLPKMMRRDLTNTAIAEDLLKKQPKLQRYKVSTLRQRVTKLQSR